MDQAPLTIVLDADLSARVRGFVSATGEAAETIVRRALERYVEDWSETLERLAEYDRTGVSVDAGEALTRFRANVADAVKSHA